MLSLRLTLFLSVAFQQKMRRYMRYAEDSFQQWCEAGDAPTCGGTIRSQHAQILQLQAQRNTVGGLRERLRSSGVRQGSELFGIFFSRCAPRGHRPRPCSCLRFSCEMRTEPPVICGTRTLSSSGDENSHTPSWPSMVMRSCLRPAKTISITWLNSDPWPVSRASRCQPAFCGIRHGRHSWGWEQEAEPMLTARR